MTQASGRLKALNVVLRRVAKPRLAATETPAMARRDMNRFSRLFLRRPPYLLHLVARGAPDLHWISVGQPCTDRVLLYFHGGAYVAGSPWTHAGMLGRLSKLSGLRIAAPAYGLAPERPAPGPFEDAVAAHRALLRLGYRPGQILLGGDSAGGGLALSLLADLCARDLRPGGIVCFSPWVDMTLSGDSLHTNARRDPFLPVSRTELARDYACGDLPHDDPRVSPLFARFDAPPPARIMVGSTEILLDDAHRMAARLRVAGGQVELQEWDRTPHIWPIFDGYIPEAREALQQAAEFLATC